jgi:hypothetical protein
MARLKPSARRRSQSVTLRPTWRDWLGARPRRGRGRAAGSEGRHDPTFEAPGGPRRVCGPSRQSGPGSVSGLGVRLGGSGRPERLKKPTGRRRPGCDLRLIEGSCGLPKNHLVLDSEGNIMMAAMSLRRSKSLAPGRRIASKRMFDAWMLYRLRFPRQGIKFGEVVQHH